MIIESIIGGLLIFTPIDKNADDYKEQIQEVGQAKCLADNMYFEARNQGTAAESLGVLDKLMILMMQCIILSNTDASFPGTVMVNLINQVT